jgi:lambda repressor-like predicted transcriptional regulator
MAKGTPAKAKRNKEIVALKLSGMSLRELGKKFKISHNMVKLIYDRDLPKYKDQIVKALDR